jgi:hypothetical protein
MDAYIYRAELLCTDCAEELKVILSRDNPSRAYDEKDSDWMPQGPVKDGGGEADEPQHCQSCGKFLENLLTAQGYVHVNDMARDPSSYSDVVKEWIEFYEIDGLED